jgi:hypothetical protein
MTIPDVCDFAPYLDAHTRDTLDDAAEALAILRGLHNLPHDHGADDFNPWRAFRDEPALRLHLLASLRQQLNAELLHAVLAARDHGYTHGQIAVLLNLDHGREL